jgi:cytochrome c-type biogenesis protein CcmH/NrfF
VQAQELEPVVAQAPLVQAQEQQEQEQQERLDEQLQCPGG